MDRTNMERLGRNVQEVSKMKGKTSGTAEDELKNFHLRRLILWRGSGKRT